MKISYADYIKKTDVSVLVAEVIFSELEVKYPIKFISDVADTTSGGTPSRGNVEYYNGDIPWLKSGELNDGLIENAEEYITKKGLANSSAKLHPKNTLLLAMYGATAGRIGIAQMEVSTNQAICALFPNENVLLEYLFWFLRQYRYKFIEISKGGAQPNISQSVINVTKIPVPDITLQKQISDTLTKIENEGLLDISIIPKAFKEKVSRVFTSKNNVFEIDIELNHQLSLVKKLRQQILQDAVQGKLVEHDPNDQPASELLKKIKTEKEQFIKEKKLKNGKEFSPIKADEIPFEIPDNWIWCRLGEICKIKVGSTPSRSVPSYWKGNIPWVSSGEVANNYISETKEKISKSGFENSSLIVYPKGSVLVAMIGQGKTRGQTSILKIDATTNQNVAGLIIEHSHLLSEFLWYFFLSRYEITRGGASGGNQPALNGIKISNTIFPLPPISTQYNIIQKLNTLMQYCDSLEESIKQSSFQNEKLLQQVLREALQNH
jgi:type I restriction enzyme S subunit